MVCKINKIYLKESHMDFFGKTVPMFGTITCMGAAALVITPDAVWSATQAAPLAQGEISRNQVLSLSGQHPYLWNRSDKFHDLGETSGNLSQDQKDAGFAWDPGQGLIVRKPPSGLEANVLGSDPSGTRLVGWQQGETGRRAFVWNGTEMQDLNTLTQPPVNTVLTEAQDIGASGTIVGHATNSDSGDSVFIWSPTGSVHFLPVIDSARPGSSRMVSSRDHVIGQADLRGTNLGYIWQEGEGGHLLTTPEGSETEALGVNGTGDVVGAAISEVTGDSRAMLWPAGDAPAIDLNERLSDTLPDGVRLFRAEAINEAGEIAAYGLTERGRVSLFLLTPQPGAQAHSYTPEDLGEVYLNAADQPLSALKIAENSDISGACVPLAQACPASENLRAQELAELLGVTNLFDPAGGNGGIPVLALPDGGLGTVPAATTTPTSGSPFPPTRSAPPSTPFFAPLTVSSGATTTTTAPVPVPGTIWGLLLALSMLLLTWTRQRYPKT